MRKHLPIIIISGFLAYISMFASIGIIVINILWLLVKDYLAISWFWLAITGALWLLSIIVFIATYILIGRD